MITQDPKAPIWIVKLQMQLSQEASSIVGPDGRPMRLNATYGEPHDITVHAKDEETAKAYVEQQNPGCRFVSAEKVL